MVIYDYSDGGKDSFAGVRMCSVFYIPGWDILGAKLYMRRVFFLHALILSYVRDKIGRA